MSDFIRSFHRVLTLSLYGFFLVFVIFVANGVKADGFQGSTLSESEESALAALTALFDSHTIPPKNVPTYTSITSNGSSYLYHYICPSNSDSCSPANQSSYYQDGDGKYLGWPVFIRAFSYSQATHDSYACPSSEVFDPLTSACIGGPPLVCNEGDYGDCKVACAATDFAPAGFTGYGKTCGAPSGTDISFTDNPVADYACLGSSGLLKCDTGLNNGQIGSGSGGSHTVGDTFYEYCKTNSNDYECQQTFGSAEIPTCQNGAAFDSVLGCDYPADETIICPVGSQINSNSACVSKVVSTVPIIAPDPQYVGGTLQGGGDSNDDDGDPSLDSEGIIDAVEDVEQSVDEGNAIAQAILDEMLDDLVSGGGTCDSAPSCSGDAIACAQVQQTWLLRCETPESDYSALCTSPFSCSGDSFSCARDEFYYDLACATDPLTQGQALSDEARDATGAALGNLATTLGMDLESMGENAARREEEGYQSFETIDVEQIVADADLANSVAGSCPSDISFTILNGQEFVIPISDYCDILFYIGVLIRLSAGFVGLRIIFTGLMRV